MYSSNEICNAEQYLEVIEKLEQGSLDCGYTIVIHEAVNGTHDAISYILKNVKDGDLKDTLNKVFFRYNCSISTKVADTKVMGKQVYHIEINLKNIPSSVCKKIIGLVKAMKDVAKENKINKLIKRKKQ